MSTFTKEQLIAEARANIETMTAALSSGISDSPRRVARNLRLNEIAMASLEAEPSYFVNRVKHSDAYGEDLELRTYCYELDAMKSKDDFGGEIVPVYTVPPAPFALPVQHWEELCRQNPDMSIGDAIIRAAWWNHCAAMLQGAEPVTTDYKLPDGYVLVPVEPTAEMLQSGISAHFERSQTQIHDRPAPGPMECAYVAMLAAAPQQEVK